MLLKVRHNFFTALVVLALLSASLSVKADAVVSVTPAGNAQQVAATSDITVVFDAVISPVNLSTTTFRVWSEQTGIITGSFTGSGTNTITFDPGQNFRAGEVITITLTTGLGLTTAYTWQFTIASAAVTANFVTRTPISTGTNSPYSVFAADIDNDGDLDVTSASKTDDNISWHENDGSENFTTHTITTSANTINAIYPADLEADGDMDVLWTTDLGEIAWYENDGSQNFVLRTIKSAGGYAGTPFLVDLDGDGDLDVLTASGQLVWYENNGLASFTAHAISTNASYVVHAMDMDADGHMDVLSILNNKIAWYRNNGSAGFTEQPAISAIGGDSGYATDFDRDGDVDVLASSSSSVRWYENDGSPVFIPHTILNNIADLLYDVYPADLDGDNDLDVLVGKAGLQGVAMLQNDGSENFTYHGLTTAAMGVLSVYAADIDEDGDLDVLSASFADDKIAWYTNNLPPVIAGALTGLQVEVSATVSPFPTVTLSDRDATQPLAINVQLDNAAKGTFTSASLTAAGFTDAGAGNYTFAGTASDAQAALRSLVFAPATGRLAMNTSETVSFTLTANDQVSPVATDNATSVVISERNNAPSFTKGADITINEDAAAQNLAGWATNLAAGPPGEPGQSLNFQVSNDNNALFSVQPAISASGALTFTPATNAWGAATVTVVLQDDGGTANGGVNESAPVTFTITLNAVNEVPSFTKGADVVASEDDAVQTIGGWATNMSAGPSNESGQTLNFNVTNDNNALFSVQPAIDASGTLTFTPAEDAWGSATVTVTIVDDGGVANGGVDESTATTFTLTLDATNDAPSFTKGTDITAMEDAAAQNLVAWATSISEGPANESAQSVNFQVTNDNNTLFNAQPAIDASGTLTFTPAPNVSGAATVTVSLQDNGGTANGGDDESPAVTFTINLNEVNDVPSFTKGADVMASEDDPVQTVGTWATNMSAGPSGESAQTLSFNVTNDNNALFSVQPAIDASGTLTFTPAVDAWGSATVTVIVKDDGGITNGGIDESASTTFMLTLDATNDAPSFTKGADVTVNEDAATQSLAAWATNISAGPSNESAQSVNFLVSNDNNALFSVQPAIDPSGTLTFTPAPDAWGDVSMTVQLEDDGGTANGGVDKSVTTTFTVSILASNKAPGFTKGADVAVNEDAPAQSLTGWATNLFAGPSNESGQSLSFLVSNDNNTLFSVQPAIDASGTLRFTAAPDVWGEALVTVVLHDNGGTANGGIDKSSPVTFIITVHAVNDAPFMDPVEDITATVNSEPFTVTLTGLDPGSGEAGQPLTVTALSDRHSLLADPTVTMQGNGTATLQLAPIQGVIDMATITVVIHDNGGTGRGGQDETIMTFSVTISDAVQPVFIPTLFSPNGDGTNDMFRLRAAGIADIRFRIYSAEGHEVFQTTDVITATEIGWNGRYQGRDMPPGIYTWTLQGHYHDGSALTNGNNHGQVMLLR